MAKGKNPMLGRLAQAAASTGPLIGEASRFAHSFEVDIALVRPDPFQARKHFGEHELQQLAESMRAKGQLAPVLLRRDPDAPRNGWLLTAGERRWRAAQMLGWPSLLAIEHRGDSPRAAGLIENLQRVDLTPLEEARGYKACIEEEGLSQAALASLLGKTRQEISAALKILSLPADILDELAAGSISASRGLLEEIAKADPAVQPRLIALLREDKLTVRMAREMKQPARTSSGPSTRPMLLPKTVESFRKRVASLAGTEIAAPQRESLLKLKDEIEALLRR